jgi:hypothetical protein
MVVDCFFGNADDLAQIEIPHAIDVCTVQTYCIIRLWSRCNLMAIANDHGLSAQMIEITRILSLHCTSNPSHKIPIGRLCFLRKNVCSAPLDQARVRPHNWSKWEE